jgi:hypothetical protein
MSFRRLHKSRQISPQFLRGDACSGRNLRQYRRADFPLVCLPTGYRGLGHAKAVGKPLLRELLQISVGFDRMVVHEAMLPYRRHLVNPYVSELAYSGRNRLLL